MSLLMRVSRSEPNGGASATVSAFSASRHDGPYTPLLAWNHSLLLFFARFLKNVKASREIPAKPALGAAVIGAIVRGLAGSPPAPRDPSSPPPGAPGSPGRA